MQLVQPLPDREFLGGVTIQRMHGRLWISGADLRLLKDNSGTHDGITWYYYNRNQIIETHDGNGKLINQVYHAERARGGSVKEYIDEIVAMRTECGRVYVHQAEGDQCGSLKDWNVIGLSDVTGRVLERYYYSPYGELEVVRDAHFFDYDDDGDVDDDDETAFTACIGETSGDCLRFDADCDGEVTEVDDGEEFGYYTATLTANTELQRIPATTVSTMGNPFGHQGLAFDVEIGSYQVRRRWLSPGNQRFGQRDPAGSLAGLNLYEQLRSNPLLWRDPSGLIPDAAEGLCCMSNGCCNCGRGLTAVELLGLRNAWRCKTHAEEASAMRRAKVDWVSVYEADAFQHCYGQCLAALDRGGAIAQKCGDIHEACGRMEGNEAGDETRDQHNNALGRSIANRPGMTEMGCHLTCLALATAGGGQPNCHPAAAQAYTCNDPEATFPPNPTMPLEGCNPGDGGGP